MHALALLDSTAWGLSLLDAALKGAALLAAIALVALCLRKMSAASRHLAWSLGAIGLILLPVLSALLPAAWQVPVPQAWLRQRPEAPPAFRAIVNPPPRPPSVSAPTPPPGSAAIEDAATPGAFTSPPAAIADAEQPAPLVSVVQDQPAPAQFPGWVLQAWLAGAGLVLFLPLLGCWQIARLRRSSSTVTDPEWVSLLDELRAALGVRRRVLLLMSGRMAMPITWGALRPVLLLPAEAHEWPEERRRMVLLHELAHIARWDWLTQMLAQTACALHWFNPLVWLAARRMRIEREQACDDLVLASGSRASDYAAELLQFAHRLRTGSLAAFAAVPMARPSSLEGRLLAILDGKRRRGALTAALLALGLVLLAAIIVPVAMLRAAEGGAKPAESSQNGSPETQNSWRVSGTVTDDNGHPLRGVEIRVACSANIDKTSKDKTDEAGRYEVDAVPSSLADKGMPDPILCIVWVAKEGWELPPGSNPNASHSVPRRGVTKVDFVLVPVAAKPAAEPRHEQTRAVLKLWHDEYRDRATVPHEAIARLAVEMRELIEKHPNAAAEGAKLKPMLPRLDEEREWAWDDAAKLMDEICDVATGPVGWLELKDQFRAYNRAKAGEVWPAEKLAGLPFGPEVGGGLRAAWIFEPRKDAYSVGEILKGRILFHNAGKQPIEFLTDAWHQNDGWNVIDAAGKKVTVKATWYTGVTPYQRIRLQPGQVAEVGGHAIGIGAGDYAEAYSQGAIGAEMEAKPGDEMRCTWNVSIKASWGQDQQPPAGQPELPNAIATGEVKFRVVAADPNAAKAPGLATFTGRYDLAPGIKLQVTQVTSGKNGEPTKRENSATILWMEKDQSETAKHLLELPPGLECYAISWPRGGSALWIGEADRVRKVDFSDRAKVREEEWKWSGGASYGGIPADVRALLEKHRPKPEAKTAKTAGPSDDELLVADPVDTKKFTAAGRVTDADGKPLEGVEIWVHTGMGSLHSAGPIVTGKDGRYQVEITPGFQQKEISQFANITARKSGWFERNLNRHGAGMMAVGEPTAEAMKSYGVTREQVARPGRARTVDFVMAPAATVKARLLGRGTFPSLPQQANRSPGEKHIADLKLDGGALGQWKVWLTGPQLAPASSVFASATTDQQGGVTFRDVPVGFEWQIQADTSEHRKNPVSPLFKIEKAAEYSLEVELGEEQKVLKILGELKVAAAPQTYEVIGTFASRDVQAAGLVGAALNAAGIKFVMTSSAGTTISVARNDAPAAREALAAQIAKQKTTLQLVWDNHGAPGGAPPLENGFRIRVLATRVPPPGAPLGNEPAGELLKNFRVIAGVPSSVSSEFEKKTGASAVAWQPHTLREGKDGTLLWPMDKAYDEMVLRVEADGYIPEQTRVLKKKDGPAELGFTLTPDRGVKGRALLPDGKAAAGATIVLAMAMRDAVIDDGKIRQLGAPPAPKPGDEWRKPRFFTADGEGNFTLPTETDPAAAVLIVHDAGVLEMRYAKFSEQPEVKLQRWGKIEGRVQWGDVSGAGEEVNLATFRDEYGYPGMIAQYEKTKADAQGRFVFEKVLPGLTQISCPIVFDPPKNGVTAVNLQGRLNHYTVLAGEPTVAILGGGGRTVRGRLVGLTSWEGVTLYLALPAPPFHGGDDPTWAALNDFQNSPSGKSFARELKVKPDGTFEIPKVLPADYTLNVGLPGGKGSGAWHKFNIKPEDGHGEPAAEDLGEIKVAEPKPAPGPANPTPAPETKPAVSTPTPPKAADATRPTNWGPPAANGLRAGFLLAPAKERHAYGEVLTRFLFIENTGTKAVKIRVLARPVRGPDGKAAFAGGFDAEESLSLDADRKLLDIAISRAPAIGAAPDPASVLKTIEPGGILELPAVLIVPGKQFAAPNPASTLEEIRVFPGEVSHLQWRLKFSAPDGEAQDAWAGELQTNVQTITVDAPAPEDAAKIAQRIFAMQIGADGKVTWDGETRTVEETVKRFAANPDNNKGRVILRAARDVAYDKVVPLLNALSTVPVPRVVMEVAEEPPKATDPKPAARSERIAPGENLEIWVNEDASFNGKYLVRPGGHIVVAGIGRINVAGQTQSEAEATVRKALQASALRRATITLERAGGLVTADLTPIDPAAPIEPDTTLDLWVNEEASFNGKYAVRKGGYIIIPNIGRVTVAGKTLSAAETAVRKAFEATQLRRATVTLERAAVPIKVGAGDPTRESGGFIFLSGEFRTAKPFKITPETALSLRAVMLASGGWTDRADLTKVRVMRVEESSSGNRSKVEEVDFKKMMTDSPDKDVVLHAGDVILIPSVAGKKTEPAEAEEDPAIAEQELERKRLQAEKAAAQQARENAELEHKSAENLMTVCVRQLQSLKDKGEADSARAKELESKIADVKARMSVTAAKLAAAEERAKQAALRVVPAERMMESLALPNTLAEIEQHSGAIAGLQEDLRKADISTVDKLYRFGSVIGSLKTPPPVSPPSAGFTPDGRRLYHPLSRPTLPGPWEGPEVFKEFKLLDAERAALETKRAAWEADGKHPEELLEAQVALDAKKLELDAIKPRLEAELKAASLWLESQHRRLDERKKKLEKNDFDPARLNLDPQAPAAPAAPAAAQLAALERWPVVIVESPTGKPMANVTVRANSWPNETTLISDGEGRLEILLQKGKGTTVQPQVPGWVSAQMPFVGNLEPSPDAFLVNPALPDPAKPLRIEMWPGVQVTGRLVGPGGEPLPMVRLEFGEYIISQQWKNRLGISLERNTYDHGDWANWSYSVVTGSDGTFTVTVPPAEARSWLRLSTSKFPHASPREEIVYQCAPLDLEVKNEPVLDEAKHEVISLGDVALKKGVVVSGRILDAQGKPMPDLKLHVKDGRGNSWGASAETNAAGEFRLWPLPAGSFQLSPDARFRGGDGEPKSRDVRAVFVDFPVELREGETKREVTLQARPFKTVDFEWVDRRAKKGPVSYYGGFDVVGKVAVDGGGEIIWRSAVELIERDGKSILTVKVPATLPRLQIQLVADQKVTASYEDDQRKAGPGLLELADWSEPKRRVIYGDEPRPGN